MNDFVELVKSHATSKTSILIILGLIWVVLPFVFGGFMIHIFGYNSGLAVILTVGFTAFISWLAVIIGSAILDY